eukprot:TRINITY_DN17862_c0_g2_i1.p2 TRINITY_DN17862_c0_g2~~TRINITY_DN17862_c0_g2_i1.p2  ORF type:complete len:215 (+),score=69.23 TRINITY_DN17862_c0_g2_i1:36-647(+)
MDRQSSGGSESSSCVEGAAVGRRLLQLARDLVAKRAVERYIRRREARAAGHCRRQRPRLGDFAQLPCCAQNLAWQESCKVLEDQIQDQNTLQQVFDHGFAEDTEQLAIVVDDLTDIFHREGPVLDRGDSVPQLTEDAARLRVEVEQLRAQLRAAVAEEAAERQRMTEARCEAARLRATAAATAAAAAAAASSVAGAPAVLAAS